MKPKVRRKWANLHVLKVSTYYFISS